MPEASPTPSDTDEARFAAERIEAGRLLFARPWVFLRGAAGTNDLPPIEGIEVAFAGRSNVGKSSLLNALVGRRDLARTSNTPGRTRELNYFAGEAGPRIVDMPGYGYAKVTRAKSHAWTDLVLDYLRGRPNLRRVYLLIDSRHGIQANDGKILDLLDKAAVSYQLVLTKVDKLKRGALAAMVEKTGAAIRKRPAAHPVVLATSAETGEGMPELRAEIAALS